VSGPLRAAGLALLVAGALIIARQVLRAGAGDLMPGFAIPALGAAVIVYPLAAVALVRAPTRHAGRLASPGAAAALLVAASLVQFAAPWMLTSGK
jgi:hypothetical protein